MFWSRWHAGQPDLSIVHRLKVANGELEKPKVWDPVLETLAERGALHEQGFIEHIKAEGLSVTVIDGGGVDPKSVAATREAMARGEAFIVQGALQAGKWKGRADVLRRVETPSRFGPWSYEVIDTKLARETKGNTVLQISLYSDLLSETQEAEPTSAFVVTPGTNFVPRDVPGRRLWRVLSACPEQSRELRLGCDRRRPLSRADRTLRDMSLAPAL